MPNARALRLDRGLTFAELALQTGISARSLAEFEYGLQALDRDSLLRLAEALGVAPGHLAPRRREAPQRQVLSGVAPAALAGLISALLLAAPGHVPDLSRALQHALEQVAPLPQARPANTAPTIAPARPTLQPAPTTVIRAAVNPETLRRAVSTAEARPAEMLSAMPQRPQPTLVPQPAFTLQADGPHGCPLVASGRVQISQGYGVGTHAPAKTWGAVDLVVDADGDGAPEPGSTQGAQIVATLGGIAHVFPNSWPGGNFVLIVNDAAGWSTAYAHLDTIAVADGQRVETGAPVGTVGSTGMATGPHLHYEVRGADGNIDPSPLIGCS